MARLALAALAAALLALPAYADDPAPAAAPPAAPPAAPAAAPAATPAAPAAPAEEHACSVDDLIKQIDALEEAIKKHSAYGHAGGHFKKSNVALGQIKKQLHAGCAAVAKAHKGGKKAGKH